MELIKELTRLHESADDVIDQETYMKMMRNGAVRHFERIISDEGFDAIDDGNLSVAIYDMQNAEDPEIFSEYGIDLGKHSDCVKLAKSIEEYGF